MVGGGLGVGVDEALLARLVLGPQVIMHGGPVAVAFAERHHGSITEVSGMQLICRFLSVTLGNVYVLTILSNNLLRN